jgi:acetate---CoA ligase (ADP-forming)
MTTEATPPAPLTIEAPPPGYPVAWSQDGVIRDGATVRIRPIAPEDRDALQAMVRSMSHESSYHRFFRVKKELLPEELDHFTQLDYDKRMAFVAILDGLLVGVGRYDAIEGAPDTAEAAFAVADEYQQRGIGSLLLYRLTEYARLRGINAFVAHVLADNHVMLRVFRNAGYGIERSLEDGVFTLEFPTEESETMTAIVAEREKRATAASLMPVMAPSSVAVIGASRDPSSIGGRLFANILAGDFTGPAYPVNPTTPVVRSVAAYASILEVPGPVDLAFIVVPAHLVVDVARECASKGVRGLVVISAGFSETGEEGAAREAELMDVVRSAGMRMVGPNCMGLVNTDPALRLDGQFGPVVPPRGNVSMSSQSGALGLAILDYAANLNIGIASFVSVGNLADVSGDDLLLYWEDDPATDVILLYMESFGNPRRFARVARRIARQKPIVAVKSGRTLTGARAASSHTGSLASVDVAVDALFRQAGVIRVDTLDALFDVTGLLANQPIPAGRRVGIVTNAGGPAVLAVDALVSRGLEVPELSGELQARLRGLLAAEASVANPVDMIAAAGPGEYRSVLDVMLTSDELDAVMAIFIPPSPDGATEVAAALRDAGETHHGATTYLTVYMHSEGAPDVLSGGQSTVPSFAFPERAARALSAAVGYGEWLKRPEGEIPEYEDVDSGRARTVIDAALNEDEAGVWLEPDAVSEVLAAYRLATPVSGVATSEEEAIRIASGIEGPVVLKVISPTVLHKTDVGGVVVGVRGPEEVGAAYRQVTAAVPDAAGAMVQEYVGGDFEVLIGMFEDPNFGPLLVFGLGGVFVELIEDVAFRIHPLTDVDAAEMVRDVKSAPLLQGYRGAVPADLPAIEDALLRVSAMIEDLPEIVEMDMNPVKVGPPGGGVTVVDARIRVRSAGLQAPSLDL